MPRPRVRAGDTVIVLVFLLLSIGVTVFAALVDSSAGRRAVVTVCGKKEAVLRLDRPTVLEVEGAIGKTVIEVGERGVCIRQSPCPNHYCIRMGYAGTRGQTIVCAPNHVSIRIIGDNDSGVDGVVG